MPSLKDLRYRIEYLALRLIAARSPQQQRDYLVAALLPAFQ